MRASQVITLQIWTGTVWQDYTDGLINAKIVRGAEEYTGPLTQPDVGQLTLISRNANLDPYNNGIVKYNAPIRVNAAGQRIFTGRIEGINVDYRPKGEPAIVTINAIDMIGTLHKHILSDDFVSTHETTLAYLNNLSSEVDGFINTIKNVDNVTYSHGHSDAGTTALEGLSIRAKTDLGFVFANSRNEIEYYRRDKDDALHPYNANPVEITFDYYGNGESYRAISLSDGFEKIVNSIEATGPQNAQVTSTANDSINLWGKSSATLELQTHVTAEIQTIVNEVLTEMAEPIREIYKISWDALLNPDKAKNIDISHNIAINHKVSDTFSINRKYSIVGITHEINADEWLITYALRNFDYQSSSIPNPVIVITPTIGDTNTNFTVTWTHPNPELFTSTYWNLDETFTSTNRTVVVNYDIVGTKTIELTATTIYGYTKEVSVQLEVAIAPPIASFTYAVDANRVYNFTFTGDSATTYEWTFGDGSTSSEKNPSHYYFTGGSRTITVKATNSLGFTTSSQVINTLPLLKIPVRYVRIRWTDASNNVQSYRDTFGTTSNFYSAFYNFQIRKTDNTAVTNWIIESHEEFTGFFGEARETQIDEFNRNRAIPVNTLQQRMTSPYGSDSIGAFRYRDTANTDEIYMSTIIDLGQEYFDIKDVQITKSSSSAGFSARLLMDVSRDQGVWYRQGETYQVINQSTTSFTFSGTANSAPLYTNPTATPLISYLPIRYVRIVSNVPTTDTSRRFQFNEILAMGGGKVAPYNGTFTKTINAVNGTITVTKENTCDHVFGYGAIDATRNTGTAISYPVSFNNSTITNYLSYYAQPLNPGTSLNQLNFKKTNDAIYWEETQGTRTLMLDFGQPIKKLTSLHFDTRTITGTTTQVPNQNFKVTIYVSSDYTNWTNMGEYSLQLQGSNVTGGVTMYSSAPWQTGTVLTLGQIDTTSMVPITT